MKQYDVLVIGFGKAGKTLAAKLANQGKKVALVERSSAMYGGTCINIGCIPTKTLLRAATEGLSFEAVMAEKDAVVSRLNAKNFGMIDAVCDIYTGHASFVSDKVVVVSSEQESLELTADVIIINTGAESRVLPIEGLATSKNVFDSTGIQQLDVLPKRLGIIGGGNIGLEFATLYNTLGSTVTILESSPMLLGRYEETVRHHVLENLEKQGVVIQTSVKIQSVSNNDEEVVVTTEQGAHTFDVVLYATGRKPNIDDLGLENTHITVTEQGVIEVDEFCQTAVENVFAVGDVNGGLQFTYVSLDDFRIVFGYLNGDTTYSLKDRLNVPNTVFINPPLSAVGLTEQQAKEKYSRVGVKELPVAAMPKGHVNGDLRGLFKVVVDLDTQLILGATLYGEQSHELINTIVVAMDNRIPYTYFTKQLFTHPTMSENFNDLFAI